jgi:hypothetical protein
MKHLKPRLRIPLECRLSEPPDPKRNVKAGNCRDDISVTWNILDDSRAKHWFTSTKQNTTLGKRCKIMKPCVVSYNKISFEYNLLLSKEILSLRVIWWQKPFMAELLCQPRWVALKRTFNEACVANIPTLAFPSNGGLRSYSITVINLMMQRRRHLSSTQ